MHLQNFAVTYINESLVGEDLEIGFCSPRTLYEATLDVDEKFRRIQSLYEGPYA